MRVPRAVFRIFAGLMIALSLTGCTSLAILGFGLAKKNDASPADETYFKADPDLQEITTTQTTCTYEHSSAEARLLIKKLKKSGATEYRYVVEDTEYVCADDACARLRPIGSVSKKPVILLNSCSSKLAENKRKGTAERCGPF